MFDSALGKLIDRINAMSRGDLVEMLRSLPVIFDVDFTDEYLAGMSLERLRHVTCAVALRARSAPSAA